MKVKKLLTMALAGALFIGTAISANAAELDIEWYASKNPDVVEELGNSPEALRAHYEMFGRKEGRAANSNDIEAQLRKIFKAEEYAAMYPDVKDFYGGDAEAMFQHYISYGLLEARRPGEKISQAAAVSLKNTVVKAMEDAGVTAAPGSVQLVEIITGTIAADAGGVAVQQALAQAVPEVEKAVAETVKEATKPAAESSGGGSSSGGSNSSGGSGSGEDDGGEESTEKPEKAVWAPLVDRKDGKNIDVSAAVNTTYDSTSVIATVSFTMNNGGKIPKHSNGETEAYWFGIGVPYNEGYSYDWGFAEDEAGAKGAFSEVPSGNKTEKTNVDAKGNATFYWGYADPKNATKKWGYLIVKKDVDAVAYYIINFGGLAFEEETDTVSEE